MIVNVFISQFSLSIFALYNFMLFYKVHISLLFFYLPDELTFLLLQIS